MLRIESTDAFHPGGTTIDVAAPSTEHTANRRNRPALWATALSFASLLTISVGWVWARRRLYDPA